MPSYNVIWLKAAVSYLCIDFLVNFEELSLV